MQPRGITAYALSRGADISYPSANRQPPTGVKFGRLHWETLDRLCTFFEVQPGTLNGDADRVSWCRGSGNGRSDAGYRRALIALT